MNDLYISEEAVFKLKELTYTALLTPEGFDESILDILASINTLPGVATLFSCEGHVETEFESAKEPHVICAFSKRGKLELEKLFFKVQESIDIAAGEDPVAVPMFDLSYVAQHNVHLSLSRNWSSVYGKVEWIPTLNLYSTVKSKDAFNNYHHHIRSALSNL